MRRIPLLLSCLALLSPALAAADDFQGQVHMKVTVDGKAVDLDYETKPGLVKYTIPGGMGSTILDTNKHQITIIMTAHKMYMVQPIPQAAPPAASQAPASGSGSNPGGSNLSDTHTTETILGHTCEKYTIAGNNGSVTTLWAATDLGNFLGFGSGGNPMGGGRQNGASTGWARAVAGRGFFPMRVVVTDGGTEKSRMEVTSIQKQAVADSEFAPPEGFQPFSMSGVMGAMGRGQ